jgi:hypothetical protein
MIYVKSESMLHCGDYLRQPWTLQQRRRASPAA